MVYSSKYGLDKFYTNRELAQELISLIDISQYQSIVEPSAGSGSFSDQIDMCIAMDIEPEGNNILKQDFFSFSGKELKHPVLVIGNPPFGRNSSLALKFIRHASTFADTIAFILPRSFKKRSMYDKIPLNFHIDIMVEIEKNAFLYKNEKMDIPCIFAVYKKKDIVREKAKKLIPTTFSFCKKEDANVAIRRVGVYAGKGFLEVLDKSEQSHYFMYTDNPELLVEKANSIIWEHDNTVGPRSISKNELVSAID